MPFFAFWFLHSGSCTRFSYLHILENQRKLHQKRPLIFFGQQEMCREQALLKNVNVTNFSPKSIHIFIHQNIIFYQSLPMITYFSSPSSSYLIAMGEQLNNRHNCHNLCLNTQFRHRNGYSFSY